jgi:hypothetical protein
VPQNLGLGNEAATDDLGGFSPMQQLTTLKASSNALLRCFIILALQMQASKTSNVKVLFQNEALM